MSFLSFCGSLYPILKLVKSVLTLLQIAAPIVLIVFGSIDMAKAVIAGKEDEMKKAQSILLKRFIYACAIFLIFTIVTLVMNLIADVAPTDPEGNPLDVNSWRNCWNCKSKAECDAIGNDEIINGDVCNYDEDAKCYSYTYNGSKYNVWGCYSNDNGYNLIEGITNKDDCMAKNEACYKYRYKIAEENNYDEMYVWGNHNGENGFTLVEDITTEENCVKNNG